MGKFKEWLGGRIETLDEYNDAIKSPSEFNMGCAAAYKTALRLYDVYGDD